MAITNAKTQTEPVHLSNLTIGTHSNAQTIDLTVQAITKRKSVGRFADRDFY
ncbi:MAG: hypothetical protein ACJAVI_005163 [Candidatus Azotimanducaceae bacterium]